MIKHHESAHQSQFIHITRISREGIIEIIIMIIPVVAVVLLLKSLTNGCPSDTITNGCSVPINSTSFPYKVFFHPACQRHDVCYGCGEMHSWTRKDCDDGFYNDMMDICRTTQQTLRKRRHINDYVPLLRHKFKRSIREEESDDELFFMWGTVCDWAAGAYYQAVRLFGNGHYEDPSPAHICANQCAKTNGSPNLG